MKVCIFDDGFIPGLGRGPFRTPVEIPDDMYSVYKRMGLKIINASSTVSIAESGLKNRTKIKKSEENVYESIKEEIPVIETTPVVEEVVEPVEEAPVEDAEVAAEEIVEEEVDINSLTKKELIDLLTENGITCNNNMTKSQLIQLFEEA